MQFQLINSSPYTALTTLATSSNDKESLKIINGGGKIQKVKDYFYGHT